jgi:site-specific recombinase XerD
VRTPAAVKALGSRGAFERELRAYLEERRARRYSASYLVMARHDLVDFRDFLARERVTDLRAVSEAHLVAYLCLLGERTSERTGRKLSDAYRGNILQRLRSFFSHLHRRGKILLDPGAELRVPKPERLPPPVPGVRAIERVIHAPGAFTVLGLRDTTVLELLYGGGLRVSECSRLDLRDVDLAERLLLVRNGKGRKDRVVPLGARAAMALERYLRLSRPELVSDPTEQAVFLSRCRGGRLGSLGIQRVVKRHAARVGLNLSPHGLRHACATHLLRGGAGVRHVQELLGHRQLTTTALYTRVVIEDLKRAVARAHPRERRTVRASRPRRRSP